jgi:hypothetical protein
MKTSQQFAHMRTVSPSDKEIGPATVAELSFVDDEKERSKDIDVKGEENNHYYSSPKRGLIGSTTYSFANEKQAASKSRNGRRAASISTAQNVVAQLQQQASNPAYGRGASAVARMRNATFEESTSHDQGIRFKLVTEPKPDNQIKKEKRRRWKQKMRIAQEGQRKERQALDDNSIMSNQFNGRAIISCVLDNVERTKLFKQLTQCGVLADEASDYEESEFESSTSGASVSEEDEDEYSALRKDVPRGRHWGGRTRKPPSRDSSVEPSVETSVDSSILRDMVDRSGTRNKNGGAGHISTTTVEGIEKSVDEKVGVASSRNTSSSIRAATTSTEPGKIPDPHGFRIESKLKGVAVSSSVPAYRTNPSRHSSSTMSSSPASLAPRSKSFVRTFIEELRTNGESMIWHKDTTMNPSTITICLKAGYRCPDGSHGGPRLVWSAIKKDQKYGIDLFDIRSLERADALHLGNFPYAMPGRSVCLKTTTGASFIFEAATEEDAWNFLRGMRWVVARLAYNLVIGNLEVSCELLDLGLVDSHADWSPRSAMEFEWSRAMDDVTDQLVEKTLAITMV